MLFLALVPAPATCQPYSEAACSVAAAALGLQLGGRGVGFVGKWSDKPGGCFAYRIGAYAGTAHYNTRGTTLDKAAATQDFGLFRPFLHSCTPEPALVAHTGYCPAGYQSIVDMAECEAMAAALLLSDTSAYDSSTDSSGSWPQGCYWHNDVSSSLAFNGGQYDAVTDNDRQGYAICKRSGYCSAVTLTTRDVQHADCGTTITVAGYGEIPASCKSRRGDWCTISVCSPSLRITAAGADVWIFNVTVDSVDITSYGIRHVTAESGTHDWGQMGIGDFDSYQEWSLPIAWDVTTGYHCGGATVDSLEDGTTDGWSPGSAGAGACKAKCAASASCSAFVWRHSDSKCFWKTSITADTLNTNDGHDCYMYLLASVPVASGQST